MSIYKRNSGRYAVLVDLDPSSTGARRRRALGTYRTRKEAEKAERDALQARDQGIDLSPGTVTVRELLKRYVASRDIGAKTAEEYNHQADHYILPHLGGIALQKLRPAHVSGWAATIQKTGGRKGRAISARTAAHAFSLLSGALRWALRHQLVARNVCESSDRPKPARHEAKALSDGEVAALLKVAAGTRWEHFIVAALTLGCRRGELLALTWADVDLEGGRIAVSKSLSQTKASVAVKSTKTGRSRIVPLSLPARMAFRKQQLLSGQRLPTDPVFTDEIGQQFTPKAATNAYGRLATKAKLSTTSLHATRHTAATGMLAGGVDAKSVASVLGHVNAYVTMTTYSHVTEGSEQNAVDVLANRLGMAAER